MRINRSNEAGYAGMTTFEKVPLVLEPGDLDDADVVILGAPMDRGAARPEDPAPC